MRENSRELEGEGGRELKREHDRGIERRLERKLEIGVLNDIFMEQQELLIFN